MAKRQGKKQNRGGGKRRQQQSTPTPAVISTQTVFRSKIVDEQAWNAIRQPTMLREGTPAVADRERAALLTRAPTAAALIELAPLAFGVGEIAWTYRIRQFGADEVIPLSVARLETLNALPDRNTREKVLDLLL